MDTTPTAALPSSTFSTSCINAILGMFLESANTIEEIANENNLSIPTVMQCLEEQKPFLKNMLNTLELRVRLIASRAEVVAIECLREIASLGRDPEARRKAASKLLSHFGKALTQRSSAPSPRPAGKVCDDEGRSSIAPNLHPECLGRTPSASSGPHAPTHPLAAPRIDNASPPSPRPAARACDDEGCSTIASNQQPERL